MENPIYMQLEGCFEDYKAKLTSTESAAQPHFYALVDTTQSENLVVELEARSKAVRPLSLSGIDGPTLVEIGDFEPVHQWLLSEGKGKNWNIFMFSSHEFGELWTHLRKLTTVVNHKNEQVSFRYADPFVLNQYIPVLSRDQRNILFDKIDVILAELGENVMSYSYDASSGIIKWRLLVQAHVEGPTEGILSLPNIDLTGSKATPLFHFSKQQYELPVIMNMPLLIKDIDNYLREDFESRMNCYAPGFLRAMIEVAMTIAIRQFKLIDLEILRQFAEMQWRIAPGFHKHPGINRLLSDESKTPVEKWDILLSERFESPLVQAFDYDSLEDWGLPFPPSPTDGVKNG